jgi:FimV-like protein
MKLSGHASVIALLVLTLQQPLQAATLGPVDADTTLWRLALAARPDQQVTMPQVIYALWQQNPAAFRDQNLHYLLKGAQLKVPSREQMLATPPEHAHQWYYSELAKQHLPTHLASVQPVKPESALAAAEPAAAAVALAQPSRPPAQPARSEATHPRPAPSPALTPTQTLKVASSSSQLQQELGLEQRWFDSSGLANAERWPQLLSYRALWSYESANRQHQLNLEPYLRWHSADSDSNLVDLRQAYWRYVGAGWEFKAGIDTLFWGVTESQHLVDVINQSDVVAGVELEAKLGQPLLQLRRSGAAGTLDLFVLPYFRERLFPSPQGRLSPPLPVNHDLAWYESSSGKHNLDVALRYSQRFSGLDLGLSFFSGNNREPVLVAEPTGELRPLYYQMEQYGLDLLWVQGEWLWKLESIYRRSGPFDYVAATGGFEYTRVGIFGQSWDLGWLAEYQYDSRGEAATLPGQNDLFLGWRLALNDIAGTEFLFGVLQDLDQRQSRSLKLEGSLRLTDSLRLSVNGWLFQSNNPQDALYWLRRDDYLALQLTYFF